MSTAEQIDPYPQGPLRMTMAEYAQIPAVNASSLLQMRVSPKHYHHYKTHGRADKASFKLGRATHTAILEPDQFMREYALWDRKKKDGTAMPRKGEEYRTFERANPSKTVLSEKEYNEALRLRDAVRAHKRARYYLDQPGQREVTYLWRDVGTDLLCKCRVDWLCSAIVDLKSHAPRPGRPLDQTFANDAARFGYHIRAAFYQDGVFAATGKLLPAVDIMIEKGEVGDVACFNLPGKALDSGRRVYKELIGRLMECRLKKEWPGTADADDIDLVLPAYATYEDVDGDTLIIDGEEVPG